jgi:PadR family transcriptional regulator, regulatory protein PadR
MKSMPDKPAYLGEFEQLLLLAILQAGEEAYTIPLRQILGERAGRAVSRGALYTSLDRLEGKGLVRSWLGEPTAVRGGRARRYFAVTHDGVTALRAMQSVVRTLSEGLESVLEPRT